MKLQYLIDCILAYYPKANVDLIDKLPTIFSAPTMDSTGNPAPLLSTLRLPDPC